MAGGRGRSPSPYKRYPSRDDDDARSGGASPKRRKRHHRRRYGDSAAASDDVEDGQILDGASAAAAPPRSRREHGRGWRGSGVAGGGCDYYTPRTHGERSSSNHSRLDRRGSARGGDEIRERERRSGNSSHGDHARWDPAGKDPHDRHRDSTSSSKYSISDGYKQTLRFGDISIDVGHNIRSHGEMKKGTCFEQEDHELERYKEKTELSILQQQDDARGKVEVESVPSSRNVKARAGALTDTGKAAHLQNSTSRSMANSKAENKQDSQEVIVDRANITVGKPPAASSTAGSGRPPAAAGIRKSGKPDEGYNAYRFGELLGGRYEITAAHGKGVFSRVVGAKDLEAGTDAPDRVAIKIIRNNDTMYRAGKQEVSILEKLNGADHDDKRHCVRFISSFRYRNHLCLVLESLHMNLREVLKKFGRNIGLRLAAVRVYAKQMFIALKHLKTCKVLHCDIKLDNIMVNQAKNVLKLCDFGSDMLAGTNEVTPYLVSRYYRAPEIILGLPYDHPLDMWSVGCCLYELCTGKVLFQGKSNNEMLRLHMELKGTFPKKMLRSGAFTMQHFDRDLTFQDTHDDPAKGKVVRRLIFNIKPKGIGSYISNIPGEDAKTLSGFKDLLDKMFVLDPAKRITVQEALSHPFITGK
ncbi:unnamed protein product [Miscanthus lutarioriparius]|uniref:non-specific serine/threonine protein kinase n=1 Tax=Miscanthus lutarioriparius TaxID=422564 RepID=A0A811PC71_9POAL|nr:unnamed protein product [Miscanthus lutarioriparius]